MKRKHSIYNALSRIRFVVYSLLIISLLTGIGQVDRAFATSGFDPETQGITIAAN